MLGNPDDVRSVVLDEQVGVLKHMRAGSTLIDHILVRHPDTRHAVATALFFEVGRYVGKCLNLAASGVIDGCGADASWMDGAQQAQQWG